MANARTGQLFRTRKQPLFHSKEATTQSSRPSIYDAGTRRFLAHCNKSGRQLELVHMVDAVLRVLRFSFGRGSWWSLPLRAMVGGGFMQHGWAKLARGPQDFANILAALHMPAPHVLAWATILIELIGGFAVLIGALLPLVSWPMAVVLVVAIVTVHWPNGFSSIKLQSVTAEGAHFGQPGYETDLLYLAGLAALVLGGAGPFSVDRWLARRLNSVLEPHARSLGPMPQPSSTRSKASTHRL